MVIEVRHQPSVVIVNGCSIDTAPPVGRLLRVIGTPTRVDTGLTQAPLGHRNQHIHVFDSLGLHVIEHHHTRRPQAVVIVRSTDAVGPEAAVIHGRDRQIGII
jgi:hypothetical protein